MTFSKKIYIYNLVLVTLVVVASFVVVCLSGVLGISDLSPISTVCTSSFIEIGLHSAFYIWKAKCENVIKLAKEITDEELDNIQTINQIM